MFSNVSIQTHDLTKEFLVDTGALGRLIEALLGRRKGRRKRFRAVDGASLRIGRGESVGVIGANGSGKTTLLEMIAGTVTPTSGRVAVQGRQAALLELGSGFNPEFTGRENVFLYGTLMRMPRVEIEQKLPQIFSFADIGEFVDRPLKTYSSGMQVRLAFSTAIHTDPDIFLLDEVLAVGDASFQLKCIHKLEEFKKQGKTILFVSHDVNLISQFSDRVIVMSEGKVAFDGPALRALSVYKGLLFSKGSSAGKGRQAGEVRSSPADSWQEGTTREYRIRSPEAQIERVVMLDREGEERGVFKSGDEATIVIRLRANREVSEPIYGMRIKDRSGIQVYAINSLQLRLKCPALQQGSVQEIRFRPRMNLMAGEYFLSVGVSEFVAGEPVVLDRRNEVLQFRVVGSEGLGIANLGCVIEVKPGSNLQGRRSAG